MADTDPVRFQNGFTKDYNGEQGQFAKLFIIDSGMIGFNSIKRGMRES